MYESFNKKKKFLERPDNFCCMGPIHVLIVGSFENINPGTKFTKLITIIILITNCLGKMKLSLKISIFALAFYVKAFHGEEKY
jgi:hypothetical protein